ncbi:MAG: hypothetical protein H7A23_11600 [Leptospiraceae bacterium]|nr:hypothetical protein [Leptospiraceae bacterium]MCP5495190.1 hypothetical protein [Leptospiraceae bacterium]
MKKNLLFLILAFTFTIQTKRLSTQEHTNENQTEKKNPQDVSNIEIKSEILGLEPYGFLYDNSPRQIEKTENLKIIIIKTETPTQQQQPIINHYHYNYYYNEKKKEENTAPKQPPAENKVKNVPLQQDENDLNRQLTESATQKAVPPKKEFPKRKRTSGLDIIHGYKSGRKQHKTMQMERKTNLYKLKQNQIQSILSGNNGGMMPQPSRNPNIPFNNPYKQEKPGKLDHPHTDFFKNNNPYPYEVKDKKKKYYQ